MNLREKKLFVNVGIFVAIDLHLNRIPNSSEARKKKKEENEEYKGFLKERELERKE
jgi:hypothetical protein